MNIFVGNIAWVVEEDQLRQLFEKFGVVVKATILKDSITQRSRGFGFVEMPNKDESEKAIGALNDSVFEGRPLRVSTALAQRDRYRRDRYPEK